MRVGIQTGIYLAAVLEYLVKEVFDIALNSLEAEYSPTCNVIRSEHLRIVMKGDEELSELTKHTIIPTSPKKRNELYQ